MKKLLFASALCATAALFADPINSTGFESFPPNTTPSGKTDTGASSGDQVHFYFLYEADNSSEDASVVKAYGVDDNLPAFSYLPQCGVPDFFKQDQANNQYLDLSTEGGTLWRSINDTGNGSTLGDPIDLANDLEGKSVFFDTMVQFTPTEDGDTPTVAADDKLAIWLNVNESGETNLCALAAVFECGGTPYATNFILQTATPVLPNQWYRLTVEAIADVAGGEEVPGFKIYLDGQRLGSDKQAVTWTEGLEPRDFEEPEFVKDVVTDKAVFCSLTVIRDGAGYGATISGVGFKGSGKLDDLSIGTDVPAFLGVTTIDFTLTWGEGVTAVSYTLSSDLTTTNTLTSGTAVQLAPGDGTATIELIPTFDTGYEFDKVTMGETDFSSLTFAIPGVTTNATLFAKTAATAYPTYINTSDATITAKYDAWKAGVGCDDSTASAYLNQFLLNVDETTTVGDAALTITEIKENATAGWDITIGCTVSGAALTGTVGQTIVCNGYLAVSYTDDLTGTWTTENIAVTAVDATAGTVTVNVNKANAKFMKVSLTAAPAAASAPAGE